MTLCEEQAEHLTKTPPAAHGAHYRYTFRFTLNIRVSAKADAPTMENMTTGGGVDHAIQRSFITFLFGHTEEIEKKLTAYRRGSKFWRMLIFCQVRKRRSAFSHKPRP